MSCGHPHDTSCDEVLGKVYEYIDGEVDPFDFSRIAHHLEECGPCLRQYGLEETVKALVHRSCAEHAPAELRVRVLARIAEVRSTLITTTVSFEPPTS